MAEVFRQPSSIEHGRGLGIRNIIHTRVLSATSDHVELDWDGIRLLAPAQSSFSGERVPVYIAPQDVKLLYPDRPVLGSLAANQLNALVVNVQRRHDLQIIRLALPNGHELEARGAGYFYQELDLQPGAAVSITLRQEGLRILREEEVA